MIAAGICALDAFAFCLPFTTMWLKLRNVLTYGMIRARLVAAR
jgi:hypothetical protein